jgi:hypothetical protein
MMKKSLLIFAALSVFATGLRAEEPAKKPGGPKGGGFDFMEKLTDEQKECVKKYDCPKPEFKKGEQGEKPNKEEMEKNRECMKKAFGDCGIEMPERPERPEGERAKKNRE